MGHFIYTIKGHYDSFKKTVVAATLSSLLVACGGSSGGSDKPLAPPPTYDFTISAKVINKCGVQQPVANADFFLQDAQWALVSAHKTDANGQVTITTTEQKINYTVAKEELSGTDVTSVELRSFIDVNSTSTANVIFDNAAFADNSNCACTIQNLDLTYSLVNSVKSVNSSAPFASHEKIDSTSTRFNNVEVCRANEKAWPQESFMAIGLKSSGGEIGFASFTDQFDATPSINWTFNTNLISSAITVDHTKYQTLTTAQLLNNKLHFVNVTKESDQEAVIFDEHQFSDQSTYYGRATNSHQELISLIGKVISKSEHTIFSKQYENTIELSPALVEPPVDTVLFSEVQPSGVYDYSKVENYPAIHFTTTVNAKKPSSNVTIPTIWHVYGPVTGILPVTDTLPNYDYIKRDINTIRNLKIEMFNSDSTQSYNEYINAFIKGDKYPTTGPLSNYRSHYIELEK